tara:strand:- start:14610 stop:14849 length:240 start_codon:yes stop_codon:yes gene_type:complete
MSRNLRARDIAARPQGVVQQEKHTWKVQSSDGKTQYTVIDWGDRKMCNCVDFRRRKSECKHIKAVEFTILKERFGDLIR